MASEIVMKPPQAFAGTVERIQNEETVGEWEIMIPRLINKSEFVHYLRNFSLSFPWTHFREISINSANTAISTWQNKDKTGWQKWLYDQEKQIDNFDRLEAQLNMELHWEHNISHTGIALFKRAGKLSFRFFEGKTFIRLTININLFSDVIYLYNVDNQSRPVVNIAYFENAARKNRTLLKESLGLFIPKTNGNIVATDSDVLLGIEPYGFNERAILIAES